MCIKKLYYNNIYENSASGLDKTGSICFHAGICMIHNQNLNKAIQCRGKVAIFSCVCLKSASAHAQYNTKAVVSPLSPLFTYCQTLIKYKRNSFRETLLHHFTHSCSVGSLHSDSSQSSALISFCLKKTKTSSFFTLIVILYLFFKSHLMHQPCWSLHHFPPFKLHPLFHLH